MGKRQRSKHTWYVLCCLFKARPDPTVVSVAAMIYLGLMLYHYLQTDSVLSRLKLCKAFDVYEVFDVLSTVREKLREKADPFYSCLKLVILDNVASVVYPLIGGGTFADRKLKMFIYVIGVPKCFYSIPIISRKKL